MGSGLYRLFLAALVVVAHAGVGRFGTYDGFAVYSFFILSGYWIATIRRSQPLPFPAFFASRLWRLWPPFLLTALIGTIFFHHFDAADFRFFDAAYRANPLLPQTWSLSFEVQFYALAPILMTAFAAPWLWIGTAAIAALYLSVGTNLVGCVSLGFFLIGIAGATYRYRPTFQAAMIAGVACVAFAIFAQATLPLSTVAKAAHLDIGYALLFNAALALIGAPFTFWTLTRKSSKTDRALGDMSYTLYLVHHPIILLLPFALIDRLTLCVAAAIALWALMLPCEWARKEIVARWSVRRAAVP